MTLGLVEATEREQRHGEICVTVSILGFGLDRSSQMHNRLFPLFLLEKANGRVVASYGISRLALGDNEIMFERLVHRAHQLERISEIVPGIGVIRIVAQRLSKLSDGVIRFAALEICDS